MVIDDNALSRLEVASPMGLTYFKRFRMEIDVNGVDPREPRLPWGYAWVDWQPELLPAHAETKYQSFRAELDANVFPCLGEFDGCVRLMQEICHKDGFLPGATWLITYDDGDSTFCGTIQGIRDRTGLGAIQNLGITPEHRGQGLGTCLLLKALQGFRRAGLRRAFLEVTAQNEGAIKLYRRLGFSKARTVYKAVEVTPFALR
ncbi:MAG TPA: GNAT family N-acetyltransferase [Pirellulales bacterium]|nr:GNAT family N-acetyltransferase [Pirellulales bacterium]